MADNPSYRAIARLMNQWNKSFMESFPMCDDRTWPGWSAASALRVHQLALTLTLHAQALDSVTFWDERLDDVKWLLDICSEIITSGPPPTDQRDSLWLYDFCLNPPLLLTAFNCRHPIMRRKAITLMRVQHCWNNDESFNACGTAKICEMIVAVEEAGLSTPPMVADEIPKSNRIRPLMVRLAEPGKMILCYDHITDPTVVQKVVEWEHWKKPVLEVLFLHPFGEMVKYGQFQGLIRPARMGCMCKTYGAAVDEEWFLQA